MITLIAAIGENYELGLDNKMLWHLPNDFKHFKNKTLNHPIVMGRKTLESLPGLLPKRQHIVLTRDKNWQYPGVTIHHSVQEVLLLNKPYFVIGGGEIYRAFLPYADILELTRVEGSFQADTFFPDINFNEWQCTFSESHATDDQHKYAYTFETWKRKRQHQIA